MIARRFDDKISRRQQDKTHSQETGNDALGAIIIKGPEIEFVLAQSPHDDGCHEIAGDHEENIDPDKTARNETDLEMKKNDSSHRKRPKGVDIGTEFHGPPLGA